MQPNFTKIKVVFHWMYVQAFFLCSIVYVNERIYQNAWTKIHKTEMKVLMEYNGIVYWMPIMLVLMFLDWVFIMPLPILVMVKLEILKDMKMEPGDHMMKSLQIQDKFCKTHAAYQMSEPQLKRKKIIRQCRKKKHDKNIDNEEPTYKAGGFWEWVNEYFTLHIFCFVYTPLFYNETTFLTEPQFFNSMLEFRLRFC